MKATMIAPAEADDFIDPQKTIILDKVGSISVSTNHLREIHGISFSKEDTLRGVTAEARELRKHDTLVEQQLDALRTYAKTKMDYLASNLGATLSEVEFDSKTWQFHAFADKGDGSTGEKLVVDVICTDEHRSLLGQSNLYRKTELKRRFLMRRVYMVELEKRLRAEGIGDVKNKELNLALSKSGFDFEAAFAYALDHIYTPLKKLYIEVQALHAKKRKTKSDLKILEGMSDEVPLARLGERAKISRTIQTEIDALEQGISALREEGLLMVRELRSKLEVQGVRLTTQKVRLCVEKNNWNTDNAFTELLLSHCH